MCRCIGTPLNILERLSPVSHSPHPFIPYSQSLQFALALGSCVADRAGALQCLQTDDYLAGSCRRVGHV